MNLKSLVIILAPMLLVLGIRFLLVVTSADTRIANFISFSAVEIEECFEEQLEENICESLLATLPGDSFSEVRKVCFSQLSRPVGLSNIDGSSGWIMPLRI